MMSCGGVVPNSNSKEDAADLGDGDFDKNMSGVIFDVGIPKCESVIESDEKNWEVDGDIHDVTTVCSVSLDDGNDNLHVNENVGIVHGHFGTGGMNSNLDGGIHDMRDRSIRLDDGEDNVHVSENVGILREHVENGDRNSKVDEDSHGVSRNCSISFSDGEDVASRTQKATIVQEHSDTDGRNYKLDGDLHDVAKLCSIPLDDGEAKMHMIESVSKCSLDTLDEDYQPSPVSFEKVDSKKLSSPSAYASESPVWPEKAAALRSFVKEKGVFAYNSILNVLSRKSFKGGEISADNTHDNVGVAHVNPIYPIVIKGRIILYTRLGCQKCMETRIFLRLKRLSYTEINIDLYPSRVGELKKLSGSSSVPKVFFNEISLGGLEELKSLDESNELQLKINYVVDNSASTEAPWPPLSGEDDASCSGTVDELALVVKSMKASIVIKDRFYKMRRYTNCFIASEAVDFLAVDQCLEREEAVIFARKLASKMFFRHVLGKNLFEDGFHLYRFLDDEPTISSQCYNIPKGITEEKPKPLVEIASRFKTLMTAILEAYTSPDGKHVDYRSIHGSEEFARYLRIAEELQRVELHLTREQRLSFFINLYNMMTIHAILVLGYPDGQLQARKLLGEFQYVIGGCVFSLASIQHGILRANQREPYNFLKPFDAKDKRCEMTLPYPEPLVHFALVHGARSGPALRCFSPGNIDEELAEAARSFLRGGGFVLDVNAKVAYVNKILKWFSQDFGNNEVEALKHASIYLEPSQSEALLELLADSDLKVIYQPFDWELNI